MNYPESLLIYEKLKSAKNILINCHRHPDPDSIASALAIKHIVEKLGLNAKIVSPDPIPPTTYFLKDSSNIEIIDYSELDFSAYDLFIVSDTSSWLRVLNAELEMLQPEIPIIVIDHHKDNPRFGELNIIDVNSACTAEILYKILLDLNWELDPDLSTYLLTGIMGDTGGLQFSTVNPQTYRIVADLEDKGARKAEILLNLYKSYDLQMIKFIGHTLSKLEINTEKKYAWSAVNYSDFETLGKPIEGKGTVVDLFFQQIKDTDFGFVMVEYEPNKFSVSFRARTDVDISGFAKALGGGGHAYAASARFDAGSYTEALGKVHSVIS